MLLYFFLFVSRSFNSSHCFEWSGIITAVIKVRWMVRVIFDLFSLLRCHDRSWRSITKTFLSYFGVSTLSPDSGLAILNVLSAAYFLSKLTTHKWNHIARTHITKYQPELYKCLVVFPIYALFCLRSTLDLCVLWSWVERVFDCICVRRYEPV